MMFTIEFWLPILHKIKYGFRLNRIGFNWYLMIDCNYCLSSDEDYLDDEIEVYDSEEGLLGHYYHYVCFITVLEGFLWLFCPNFNWRTKWLNKLGFFNALHQLAFHTSTYSPWDKYHA